MPYPFADLTIEHSADIALMLSSCKDVESAEIPQQLALISHELRTTKNAEEFARIESKAGTEWLERNCASAYELFNQFLNKHSHRAYKEVNLSKSNFPLWRAKFRAFSLNHFSLSSNRAHGECVRKLLSRCYKH